MIWSLAWSCVGGYAHVDSIRRSDGNLLFQKNCIWAHLLSWPNISQVAVILRLARAALQSIYIQYNSFPNQDWLRIIHCRYVSGMLNLMCLWEWWEATPAASNHCVLILPTQVLQCFPLDFVVCQLRYVFQSNLSDIQICERTASMLILRALIQRSRWFYELWMIMYSQVGVVDSQIYVYSAHASHVNHLFRERMSGPGSRSIEVSIDTLFLLQNFLPQGLGMEV